MERRIVAASSSSALVGIRQTGGGFMKTLTLTLAAAALVLGATALSANAQQLGTGHAQLQNATPIVKNVACRGYGARCGPGFTWACGPYGRCFCRPCG
jgi:hypothetical protein